MGAVGKIIDGEFVEFANDEDMLVISKEMIETTPITFEKAAELANVEPNDSISVALGKLSKLYEVLENGIGTAHAGKAVVTDEAGNLTALEDVSSSDISTLEGITGNIQSQFDTQALNLMRQRYRSSSDQAIDCLDRNLSTGVYWINTNTYADTNLPEGEEVGNLVVLSNAVRLFIKYKSVGFYVNDYVNSTWQAWMKYQDIHAKNFVHLNTTDLNNIMDPGVYFSPMYEASTYKNFPYPGAGWLEVFEYIAGEIQYVFQRYTVWGMNLSYYRVHNENGWDAWLEHIPKYTANAPRLKTWTTSEWTSAGGNLPSDVSYGSVLRIRGGDEPGVPNVNDSVFLLISYAGNTESRLYTAYQSNRGSTTVPWTRIGGG